MDEITKFKKEVAENIAAQGNNEALKKAAEVFMTASIKSKYSYNFSWMGMPIIQYPQDMIAMQEIIWEVKPDLIIETGIARGGSLIYYASLLELIGNGEVLGVDIDIREHNRNEIEKHPMFKRIKMIQGSSVSSETADKVREHASGKKKVMVCLDSNHTQEHVLRELELYAPLVTASSYLVVFDTIVEHLPENQSSERPWRKGNNPQTALIEFLKRNKNFEIKNDINGKLLLSVAPGGYLKKITE